MKNWFNRLLGGAPADGAGAAALAVAAGGAAQVDTGAEIDAAYYRWLTASSGYHAPAEVERRILDDVAILADDPGAAADLVPRVPEVIPQLLASLGDDAVSNAEMGRQASQDVVLVAELIREANSAYYRSLDPVNTVEAAIMRLGHDGLRMLLARLAFRPIIKMQSKGFARRAAPSVWNQSERCALAASLMAPGMTAGAFEAYLAGLLQNVGLVVAFRISDGICEDGRIPGSRAFGQELQALSRRLSAHIAAHWEFPAEVCDGIAHAGDPGDQPLARALALGDRIAKLRLLIDAGVLAEEDSLVTEGLDKFQRRCLTKLGNVQAEA
jgi:HD-like signal output (HDOD) protein